MPYKDPNSAVAKASQKRRSDRYRRKNVARVREWNRRNAEKFRSSAHGNRARKSDHVRRQFGLSLEQVEAKIRFQKGLCGLCGRPLDLKGFGGPAVDHNHETSELRDVIHRRCNVALGLFEDDIELLKRAVSYMEKFKWQ